jgi:transposase
LLRTGPQLPAARSAPDRLNHPKGYVKRGKSDALDAEAICEAVQRPSMLECR